LTSGQSGPAGRSQSRGRIKDFNPWVISVIDGIVKDFWATVDKHPLIPVGTPDPYTPLR